MRFILASLTSFMLLSTASAHAVSGQKVKPLILNYQQMINLTTKQRARYISDMRRLFVEIEKVQRVATHEKTIFNFEVTPTSAEAQTLQKNCPAYGGWSSTLDPVTNKCEAPLWTRAECPDGQFKCNPAVFMSGCLPITTNPAEFCKAKASDAEKNSRLYISNNLDAEQTSAKNAVEQTVAQNPQLANTSTPAGRALQKVRSDGPEPQPASPQDLASPLSHHGGPPCKNNRDQSMVGDCSAFCTLCTLDKLAQKQQIRTSANWIVYLTTAFAACKDKSAVPMKAGKVDLLNMMKSDVDPSEVLNMSMKFGYCDEGDYLPYSPGEPAEGDLTGEHRMPYGLAHQYSFVGNVYDGDAHFDEYYAQFGITMADTQKLFCPDGTLDTSEDNYVKRLNSLSLKKNSKFLKCAKESLDIKKRIQAQTGSCQGKTFGLADSLTDSQRAAEIKTELTKALGKGLPVSLNFEASQEQHISYADQRKDAHCASASRLNGDSIEIQDSNAPYQANLNDPVKLQDDPKGRKIYGYTTLDCQGSTSSPSGESDSSSQGNTTR